MRIEGFCSVKSVVSNELQYCNLIEVICLVEYNHVVLMCRHCRRSLLWHLSGTLHLQ